MEISGIYNHSLYNYNNQESSVIKQFDQLISEYRDHMDDKNPAEELSIIEKIESFLKNHKTEIYQLCKANGYSQSAKDWTQHYETFFTHAISDINLLIQYHKENPTKPLWDPTLDQVNSDLTQLAYLMTYPKK